MNPQNLGTPGELWLQLGREKETCFAEAVLTGALFGCDVQSEFYPLVRAKGAGGSVPLEFPARLGGCVRAIEPVFTASENTEDDLFGVFQPQGPWAISALTPRLDRERENWRKCIKRKIEAASDLHGREVRPSPGDPEVVPAKIAEKQLDKAGSEVCLWRDASGSVRLGLTRWVYELGGFRQRDFERPDRPRRRGMLPPKLARQLINMALVSKDSALHDPFCGAGGVLLEAMSLGLRSSGSDNQAEALSEARRNLEWFARTRGDLGGDLPGLTQCDVRQLSKHIPPLSLPAVVAEGDLGPPVRGHLTRKLAGELAGKLRKVYQRALAEIRITLQPGHRVCLAVPFWAPPEGQPVFLNLEKSLALMGYRGVWPLEDPSLKPLLYRRPNQAVGRAIHVLISPGD